MLEKAVNEMKSEEESNFSNSQILSENKEFTESVNFSTELGSRETIPKESNSPFL